MSFMDHLIRGVAKCYCTFLIWYSQKVLRTLMTSVCFSVAMSMTCVVKLVNVNKMFPMGATAS